MAFLNYKTFIFLLDGYTNVFVNYFGHLWLNNPLKWAPSLIFNGNFLE